ncbi:polyprenyl synthetase family protein [Porticoccus hydrocarbonoclasticus]|mgnify:CR=1 FL=1|jgi:farnesyl diphosphate synthase/geranylgeranyl diphosphate synthase type II|uniref:polyprenyl synthetase family protein n=1 Tax=Porticoccus TaxID=1123967 RepID=UPI00056AE38D|nr:farnesyl diphosphate synthase [Porticoccus hydrocarbonoclasticus]MBG56762.1 geranyl transferase [Porticoccus sp.]|tara:strand:- start:2145 stop:3035 length:891 start_codon:yes stop_codon:yes gene_type:complete
MDTLSFADFQQQSQQRIDQHLNAILPIAGQGETTLFEAIRYSLFNGGKRIRPLLAYAAANAVGEINPSTDRVAAALEMIHAYSLIHDDLPAMDNDDLRRGKPTCHIAFDEATAILAGDGLQALAFEQLLEAQQLPPQTTLRLLAMLTKAAGIDGMVYGQAIDMAAVNQTLTLPQLEHMHRHKTGAMISASVMMGGMTAGASEGQLGALKDYGEAIGLAFQVQDDILDVTTDTAVLGKQQGSDQARNKPTYLSLLGIDGARQKAAELHGKSLSALASFDERADQLRAIANYIVKREY